jgi:hypothetical protein
VVDADVTDSTTLFWDMNTRKARQDPDLGRPANLVQRRQQNALQP